MALITRQAKGNKLTIQEMDNNLIYLESLGLSGTNYIFVPANGTDLQNATALQAAYNTAKTMSPSTTNRITIVAAPGNYKFPSTFIMDTEFIDLVSLTGNADVIFSVDVADPVILTNGDITDIVYALLIDANNTYVKGIQGKDVSSNNWISWWGESAYKFGIDLSNNLPNVVVENCIGSYFSFVSDFTFGTQPVKALSSTFINCKAAYYSFGYYASTSGTFLNCEGIQVGSDYGYEGNYLSAGELFGSHGTASGYFENCKAGTLSFGMLGTASGTFINCISRGPSFGMNASGVFINCESQSQGGFGVITGIASGKFINCRAGDYSFASQATASGTFTNCIGGVLSFGGGSTASGVFTNCISSTDSFGGGGSGTLTGKLYYCRLTLGTFKTVSGAGITRYCIDGSNATNNQG